MRGGNRRLGGSLTVPRDIHAGQAVDGSDHPAMVKMLAGRSIA